MKDNFFYFLFLILVYLFYYAPNTTASPIINGIPDDRHHFKHHVSIHTRKSLANAYAYTCGGSIISQKYILSSAHCFMKVERNGLIQEMYYPHDTAKIIAGTNQMNGPGIERDIIRVFVPAGSDRRLLYVDLAVLELSANLGVHQHPDRLAIIPLEELDPHSNAGVNQRATFCGFGWDVLQQTGPARSSSTTNKFMNARILGRNECPRFEKCICVRNADTRIFRTAYIGDSGAGLIYENKLVGVLSYGPINFDTSSSITFMRLYGYMRFIIAAQNPHGDHESMHVLHRRPSVSA